MDLDYHAVSSGADGVIQHLYPVQLSIVRQ